MEEKYLLLLPSFGRFPPHLLSEGWDLALHVVCRWRQQQRITRSFVQWLWHPILSCLLSAWLHIWGGWEVWLLGGWWARVPWAWLWLPGRNIRGMWRGTAPHRWSRWWHIWGVSRRGACWLSSLLESVLSAAGYIHQWSMQDKQEDVMKHTCCCWGSSRAAWCLAARWASTPTTPSLSEPSSLSRESKCQRFALHVSACWDNLVWKTTTFIEKYLDKNSGCRADWWPVNAEDLPVNIARKPWNTSEDDERI